MARARKPLKPAPAGRGPSRVAVWALRVACLVALAASAALVADTLHPGRKFCPMEAACAKARGSVLGSFFGVPTSVLGVLAFGALFFLTLLPERWARATARPVAFAGALAGLAFVAYQAFWLRSFCPLCLVADTSALVAAAAALAWMPRKGRAAQRAEESLPVRLRWALVALAAVVAPIAWPRATEPSWVPVPEGVFSDLHAAGTAPQPSSPPGRAAPEPTPAPFPATEEPSGPGDAVPRLDPASPPPPPPEPVAPPPASPPAPVPERPPSPVPPPPPAPLRREVVLVEYLNPFCAHCRATHERLERVLARFDAPVRRRRVHVWSSERPPAWAAACACAEPQGLAGALFDALLREDRDGPQAVRNAARRVGLDPQALDACAAAPETQARLARDRQALLAARLQGLPTLDIGRRRLMGEQSEDELLEALRAAVAD